jgi:predicted transcriptional regulator
MTKTSKRSPEGIFLSENAKKLVEAIKKYPGASAGLLARLSGLSGPATRRNLFRIVQAGIVSREGIGGRGGRRFSYQVKN